MKVDDRALARRCAEGEGDAFRELFERYERPVYNLALRMLDHPDEARDVVQTVFLKAFRSIGSYDPNRRFFSWLYRIAVNESLDACGRRPRNEPLDPDLSSGADDPARSAERADLRRSVRGALMRLPHDQRAVVILRHYLGCSYSEIAEIVNRPEKTVKSRLYEARSRLRSLLARVGES